MNLMENVQEKGSFIRYTDNRDMHLHNFIYVFLN